MNRLWGPSAMSSPGMLSALPENSNVGTGGGHLNADEFYPSFFISRFGCS